MKANKTKLKKEFFNKIDSGIGIHYNTKTANRLKKMFSSCWLPNNEFQRELFILRIKNLKNILEDIQVTKTMAAKVRRDFMAAERLASMAGASRQIQRAKRQIRRTVQKQIRKATSQMQRSAPRTRKTMQSSRKSTQQARKSQNQRWEFNPDEKFRAWDCNFSGFSKREKEFLQRAQHCCAYPKLALYLLKRKGLNLNSACHKIVDAYFNLRLPRTKLPSLTPERVLHSSRSRAR